MRDQAGEGGRGGIRTRRKKTSDIHFFHSLFISAFSTKLLPLKCSLFICIIFKMKSLSNLIFKTKSNGIMIDGGFILKTMPKKSEYLRGNSDYMEFFWYFFVLKRTERGIEKKIEKRERMREKEGERGIRERRREE